MKTAMLSSLLAASLVIFSTSVFASGYGPSPYYRPNTGAPASERGQSTLTIAAEREAAESRSNRAYGGSAETKSEAGVAQLPASNSTPAN